MVTSSTRTLRVHFEGPAVAGGVVPFDDLLSVLDHLQSAVRHMVEHVAGRDPTPGPLPSAIRQAGTLLLIGTTHGSFVAEVALAVPEAGALPDLGLEALERLIPGMTQPSALPVRVAREIAEIAESLGPGIDAVRVVEGRLGRQAVIARAARLPVDDGVRVFEPGSTVHHGRLLEVDWKDGTAELHGPSGVTRLAFGDELASELQRLARSHVVVSGFAEIDAAGLTKRLHLSSIASTFSDDSFWDQLTVEELILQQGVQPFTFSPRGAEIGNVDELLAAIFGSRD